MPKFNVKESIVDVTTALMVDSFVTMLDTCIEAIEGGVDPVLILKELQIKIQQLK